MRRSVRLFLSVKEATERYLDYIRYTDKELPSLQELFPKPGSGTKEIVQFHAQLCETMEKNGYQFKGIKVISPSHDPARVLRATHPICVPLFDNFFGDDVFSTKQCRLQYVEGGICFKLSETSPGSAVHDCSDFFPTIEVTGTRFPFYPLTLSGFACDLCSVVGVVTGKANKLTRESTNALSNYGFVLVKDDEPVEVGGGKLFLDDPLKAVPLAADYAKQLGVTLSDRHVVLCSGLTARTPSQPGSYTLQWGVYGSAHCAIV